MKKKVLSNIDIYTDYVKGIDIPRERIRVDIFESFVLKRRISDNPKDYSYQDYKIHHSQPLAWLQDYIRDHFNLYHNKVLIPQLQWGNIYGPQQQSYNRNQVEPLLLRDSADYTYIYCVDVQPNSCEFVMEYDDNRRKNRTWHVPLENNKFILFPSNQRYFISKNKGSEMNVFLTVNCEYQ
mgnify:FL=1|tara:strand:+ start:651 stop:1193 length:543 start_codon:yes stop_codon:yes gene_type:complete